jgi:ribosomal protein S18 acetylase RimI-like enzyme
MTEVFEPSLDDVLEFCRRDPVERVFLEDVARRGLGRFVATRADGGLRAICHLGTNVVPSGSGCEVFGDAAAKVGARMVIGSKPRDDRPGQPVYAISTAPSAGDTGLRPATLDDLELLVPACAASHHEELGVDPLRRDAEGFRWRTRAQIEEGRSWLWVEDGVIRFKAEASAWTPSAVQLQQVWVDPPARRQGFATRAMRDLIRLLLQRTPVVTLFVRRDNVPAIRLYETLGMRLVLSYRSILL